MNRPVTIRLAHIDDMDAIFGLRSRAILNSRGGEYSREQLQQWAELRRESPLRERILDGCVLLAEVGGRLAATNGIDLDRKEMVGLFVHPRHGRKGIGRRMVVEAEKRVVQFGLLELEVRASLPALSFYLACRYQADQRGNIQADRRTGLDSVVMRRRFPRRATAFGRRIRLLLEEFGIPADYGVRHRTALQHEALKLVSIGKDIYGRDQQMRQAAGRAWQTMQARASKAGIELQAVSAFRSVAYQAGILKRKLAGGQKITDILKVSAAPGFSEHHRGTALDITTPGFDVLEEVFEESPAFAWLEQHACESGFTLSFPRGNRHGVSYEPWHWAWSSGA